METCKCKWANQWQVLRVAKDKSGLVSVPTPSVSIDFVSKSVSSSLGSHNIIHGEPKGHGEYTNRKRYH